MVRGSGDAATLVASLRGVLASLDPTVPLYRATPLESTVRETLGQDRLVTALLTAFAVLALLLAAVGVHGVLSSEVARRRKEIGVRLALGADREAIYRFVLGRAVPAAALGLLIGLVVALVLSRAMASLVFGIDTSDPVSFAVVLGVLSLIGVIAAWIPAFRATHVSPLEAIRAD
jgi:putative ABC transport system permease protein